MKQIINLNDRFAFRLTAYGKAVNTLSKYPLPIGEDGFICASMQQIAAAFENYLFNGVEQVIENNELELK